MPATVTFDTKDFKRLANELKKMGSAMPIAVSAALNRTMEYTATRLNRNVREKYTVRSSDIKKCLKKNKSSQRNLFASIAVSGKTLSVYSHFKPGPSFRPIGNKKYKVRITIKRGHRKQILISPSAFLPKAGSSGKNLQIFARQGPPRLPIVALHTLSVPQMVSGDARLKIEDESSAKLEERIRHEIEWRINKAAAAMR